MTRTPCSTACLAAVLLATMAPEAQAHGYPDVLLLYDSLDSGSDTAAYYTALDLSVKLEYSLVDETLWDGTNPALTSYDVVVHLNGLSAGDMPKAGQAALLAFVKAGGGYVSTEWNACERAAGGLATIDELVLFDCGGRSSGTVNLPIPSSTHPILSNTTFPLSFSTDYNESVVRKFSSDPATVLLQDSLGWDALALRELGSGRVVAFHHAGNSGAWGTLLDPGVHQLMLDAVLWAARCDEDQDGEKTANCGGLDCDDADPDAFWGAAELCDSVDNDCDGLTDEADAIDLFFWYQDADNDGWGNSFVVKSSCTQPSGYVSDGGDCDDNDSSRSPGALELCDGLDQDCDGSSDEDASDALTWYSDKDGDGYGDEASGLRDCDTVPGRINTGGDCDDTDKNVSPGASETPYDSIDQDCDGADLCDLDGDGVSAPECLGLDCDDQDPASFPGGVERWYDGADQNCDGLSDFDADQDGFDSLAWGGEDCDDGDPHRYPGAPDDPEDGLITDCNLTDENDRDADGWLSLSGGGEDCDDTNSLIYPGAPDIPYDGLDADCAQDSDFDADGDGQDSAVYGGEDCDDTDPTVFDGAADSPYDGLIQDCDPAGEWDADLDGHDWVWFGGDDCDDTDPSVYPGAEELWYDGLDQDCDGNDRDADGDGFALESDCDDQDPAQYPGAQGLDTRCEPPLIDSGLSEDKDACGCGSAPSDPSALALLAALLLRRRRP